MKEKEKACSNAATLKQANMEKNAVSNTPQTDSSTNGGMVASILHEGAGNALRPEYLCNVLGLRSTRALRKEIERERKEGALILSNQNQGGYYLPATVEEVEQYKRTMEARAKTTFLSIRSARKFLKDKEGAECVKDKENAISKVVDERAERH